MPIWDLPTRFPLALVVLLFTSWLSAKLDWMRCSTVRLYDPDFAVSNCLGLRRQRYGTIRTLSENAGRGRPPLLRLARREPDTEAGHNGRRVDGRRHARDPDLQVGTGLCANDDVLTEGPLARIVGKDRSDWLTIFIP